MQRVLVTGAAGFIGSQLAERLLCDGAAVTGVDSFSSHYLRELKELNLSELRANPDFGFVEADVAEVAWDELLEGVDCVFHLAARPGVRDSWSDFADYLHNNVAATKNLLDACAERSLRVVYASSSSVYGNSAKLPVSETEPTRPISPYGATKVMGEVMVGAYAAERGLDAVGLRYFTVYGPRQRPDMGISRFIEDLAAGRPLRVYGDGRQLRDFTYVEDAVAATVAAARSGESGAVYNIASNHPYELLAVLELLSEVMDRELEILHEEEKLGDVRNTWGNIAAAARDLGYAPRVSLRDGLATQVSEAVRRRSALAAVR
jgi:UDP-glucuronate 4-epimerase